MACHVCKCQAPTQYVEFYQNIGALVIRFPKEIKGNLCKRCINQYFWKFTLTTVAVGWCGLISLIVAPIFIINNIVQFSRTTGMKVAEPDPPPAPHPTLSLSAENIQQIDPFKPELESRLRSGENIDRVTMSVGPRAGVSAIQVELYIEKMKLSPT